MGTTLSETIINEELLFYPVQNSYVVSNMALNVDKYLSQSLVPIIPHLQSLTLFSNAIRELQSIEQTTKTEFQIQHMLQQSAMLIEQISFYLKVPKEREILLQKAKLLKGELEARPVLENASRELEEELILIFSPLSTWFQKSPFPFYSFITSVPDIEMNKLIQNADDVYPHVFEYLKGLLGFEQIYMGAIPLYNVGHIIACGGEANRFPKHFAYFLPEDEGVKRAEIKKTIVFSNLYVHRFYHTTLPISKRALRGFALLENLKADEIGQNLLLWLRGHDTGHSVLLPTTNYKALRALGRFPSMVVQEAIADSYGYLIEYSNQWRELTRASQEIVSSLFVSEMIRYLLRGSDNFPDAGAAHIELSFLVHQGYLHINDKDVVVSGTSEQLQKGMVHLTQLLTDYLLTPNVKKLETFFYELMGTSEHAKRVHNFIASLKSKCSDIAMFENYTRM